MDDHHHSVEAHSLYLFSGAVLSSRVCKAWRPLCIMELHYFSALYIEHDTVPFTAEVCQRAEEAILGFATGGEPTCSLLLPTHQPDFHDHHILGSCQLHCRGIGAQPLHYTP